MGVYASLVLSFGWPIFCTSTWYTMAFYTYIYILYFTVWVTLNMMHLEAELRN